MLKAVAHDTPSHASDDLCQIRKESIQNFRSKVIAQMPMLVVLQQNLALTTASAVSFMLSNSTQQSYTTSIVKQHSPSLIPNKTDSVQ